MARNRSTPALDPDTGKPLPDGVTYRGPGQYRARKRVGGQRITKTFTAARFAVRWLTELQVDSERGQFVDRSEAERQTLGQIVERYQDEILGDDSEKRGAEKEKGHLKVLLEDPVCKIRMAALTSADLAKFRDRMKALEYAPATIVRRLNLIQTIIEHSRREWQIHIAANPAQMVKRPAGADRKRDRVFGSVADQDASKSKRSAAQSEEECLLVACDGDANPLLGPIVRFAIATAMRQGEIVGLRWSDVDLKRGTAVVRGAAGTVTKNGEIRNVPLLPSAITILKKLDRADDTRVFPIDQNVLKMRFRRAVDHVGIADLTFHDLRHIATSRLATIYTNPLDLKRVTGHKDLKSLDRYYHATAEELAARGRSSITTPKPKRVKRTDGASSARALSGARASQNA
ncbi:MAG TPA: site-specific integrase [Stellaceae bacterium]|nr:site-specific integrase [Stellaceae bacterium]